MTDDKLAVLIDADNVPYTNVKEMLEEVEIVDKNNNVCEELYGKLE